MFNNFRYRIDLFILTTVASLLIFLPACSSTPKSTDGSDAKTKSESDAPLYYDFNDVLVPRDLKLYPQSSFVYHSSGLTAGVLVFKAQVERGSLIDFFLNNMAKDNWQVVSTFKSPRTLLLFQKKNRWCVINITDSSWENLVEIWVAPYSGFAESGLLK